MEALETAKLALRKFLLENREKVVSDLIEMRKKSEGLDIYNYVDQLSDAFSFESVTSSSKINVDFLFQEIDYYEDTYNLLYLPPNKYGSMSSKKDSEISSESFFLFNIAV